MKMEEFFLVYGVFERSKNLNKQFLLKLLNKLEFKLLIEDTACGIIASRGDIYGFYVYKRGCSKMGY